MGDIYLGEPANNIVELGKHIEERRNLVFSLSAVDQDLHIGEGGTRGLAACLHSGRRRNIRLRGRNSCRTMFLCIVVIEAVYRRGGSITGWGWGRLRRGGARVLPSMSKVFCLGLMRGHTLWSKRTLTMGS